jgi:hypothetical protein
MPSALGTASGLERATGIGLRSISQKVKYTDFVDGASTAGTMTLHTKLPAYCFPLGTKIQVITGFTGDSSCVLTVGTSTTTLAAGVVDADILTMDTNKSIYTSAKTYMQYATFTDTETVQDDDQTVASNYILLTATSGSDWTAVTAGEMIVTVYFFTTVEQ